MFVDLEKSFDRVNWVKMMGILKRIGVYWRDRRLVTNLYMSQEACVRVNGELSEPGAIGRCRISDVTAVVLIICGNDDGGSNVGHRGRGKSGWLST